MNCNEVRNRLGALLDDELAPEARTALDRHLQGCAGCRAELDRLARLDAELDLVPRIEPNPFFLTRLRQRVADERAAPRRGRWPRAAVLSGVAAGLLLAALAGSRLGRLAYRAVAPASSETPFELAELPDGSLYETSLTVLAGGGND